MVKTVYWDQHTKHNRSRKNNYKDGKVLYRLMSNSKYGKTMKKLRKRIALKLVNNEKYYLKCEPTYMPHKIFDNNSLTIQKSKLALKLKKPAYIGVCILVSMYKFHYDYIKINMTTKQNYFSRILIV